MIKKATHSGKLVCENTELVCYVLSDKRRLIDGGSISKAIGLGGSKELSKFILSDTFRPFISYDLKSTLERPITFMSPEGKKTSGYEALILFKLCDVVAKAQKNGKLKTAKDKKYAEYCRSLARIFSKKGIHPQIDEVTGYSQLAHKLALGKTLAKHFSGERLELVKKVPEAFYIELFRLKNWNWKDLTLARPTVVGRMLDDLFFDRLPPELVKTLKTKASKKQLYQLRIQVIMHIYAVMALMRAASTWDAFHRSLQRAFPVKN